MCISKTHLQVIPIQHPFLRIPVTEEEKVAAKLKDGLSQDIIESVTGVSAWVSPIVLTFKEKMTQYPDSARYLHPSLVAET